MESKTIHRGFIAYVVLHNENPEIRIFLSLSEKVTDSNDAFEWHQKLIKKEDFIKN